MDFFKAHTLEDALLAISKMVLPAGVLYKPDLSVLLYGTMGVGVLMVCDMLEEKMESIHYWRMTR